MSQKKHPNILLIAIDSLLSTHMSCYGYDRQTTPNIDKFAKDAALFEQTFSPHVPTTPAYASMLTGRDSFGTQCVALRHKGGLIKTIKTLPEILRDEAGYESLCIGFTGNPSARGFDRYLSYKESWGNWESRPSRKAEALNDTFCPELEKLAQSDKPWFVMLRHMDPHSPYLPPAPYDRMFYSGDECDPSNKSMEPVLAFKPFADYFRTWLPPKITDKDFVIAQYDGAIAYMDACIQRIFHQLDALNLSEDTIVVLNGDHGETLYDHQCWFDHHGMYDVCLKVPLMIRYPGKVPAGVRVEGFNQHKDLVPTLLELAEIESVETPSLDGQSLLRLIDGTVPSFESSFYITECTWMRKHGWRTPEWKLIEALEPDFHFMPEVELYNLVQDPDENNNVAEQFPETVKSLRGQMQEHINRREKQTEQKNPIFDQPGWHGHSDIEYFTSSQEAYDTQHIGNAEQAKKIQEALQKKSE